MTRFQAAFNVTLLSSGFWLAQLATSFPPIRWGCIFVILGYFLAIAIIAFVNKAKVEGQDYYGNSLVIVTPYIGYAVALFFLIIVGVFVGWV